ncbi:hypothetical protein IFM89_018490 [Coptis chinensis]|uniref:F-box associated domain-containing protein n=1 Tax=Coptis chinensis TaxID=261450 RepID=A0A835IQX0_9MAGN|nr:hypothetical protein IFM89_018490 [Coptis chinensis]
MDREIFSTMSHPGLPCLQRLHRAELKEMEGKLCWFRISFAAMTIVIWMLEDYERQVWVERHVVRLAPVVRALYFKQTKVIHIYGDELLIACSFRKLVFYNLKLRTFRRVAKNRLSGGHELHVVPHVSSLVSLNVDGVLTLSV